MPYKQKMFLDVFKTFFLYQEKTFLDVFKTFLDVFKTFLDVFKTFSKYPYFKKTPKMFLDIFKTFFLYQQKSFLDVFETFSKKTLTLKKTFSYSLKKMNSPQRTACFAKGLHSYTLFTLK